MLTPLSIPAALTTVPGLEICLTNLAPLLPMAATFAAWLDSDERAQVARLRPPEDQTRMILRHGLRRLLLARRLSCQPDHLRFACGPWQKPVVREPARGGLHFNTANSGDWFLMAMANNVELEHIN